MEEDPCAEQVHQVEALRRAQLAAEHYRFHLGLARDELSGKAAALAELQSQVAALLGQAALVQRGQGGDERDERSARAARPQQLHRRTSDGTEDAVCGIEAELLDRVEELRDARLDAESQRYRAGVAELELSHQLGAVAAMQWRLDCVLETLGLDCHQQQQQQGQGPGQGQSQSVESEEMPPAAGTHHQGDGSAGRRQERAAGWGGDEREMRELLTRVEELRTSRLEAASYRTKLRQSEGREEQLRQRVLALEALAASAELHAAAGRGERRRSGAKEGGPASARLLVETLVQENSQLRTRLLKSEGRREQLEAELEAGTFIKAQYGTSRCSLGKPGPEGHGGQQAFHALGRTRTLSHQLGPPAHQQAVEQLERRRLELQLQERGREAARLRGVITELEATLAEAYRRQADMAMTESSWREQEGLDRRVAALEAEKATLASALDAARADADAAQHDAAVQRRLARRMQSRPAAPAEARPAEAQMAALLQKRVKVLEAQVVRLRLAASSAAEEAALAAAAPAPAADAPSAAENASPNSSQEEEANPVLLKWQADKRLQRKVEGLAAKLKEKSGSLQAALGAKARLEEQAEALRAECDRRQAGCRELRRQLQEAEQRAAPGATVPAARVQALLQELDELQARHDACERELTLVRRAGGGGGAATPLAGPVGAGCVAGSARSSPGRAEACGAERRYNPGDYGGIATGEAAAAAPSTNELLRRDVLLFEVQLERDQAAAHVARLQRRLQDLLPYAAAAKGKEAEGQGGSGGARGSGRAGPSLREAELLDTVGLLKSALERTKKGLASGVSSSRFMAAVERAKQLRARVEELEGAADGAGAAREELARAQQQLGSLQAVVAALRSQLRAARQRRDDGAAAAAEAANGQLAELERAVAERDAELEAVQAVQHASGAYQQELRVLVAAGLRPKRLVEELLHLRPRLRELESENAVLRKELTDVEAGVLAKIEGWQAGCQRDDGRGQGQEGQQQGTEVAPESQACETP